MTHILTLDTLIAKGACAEAQEKFTELFPNGAPLTVEAFVNVADKFDWHCAAKLLLTPRNQVKFEKTTSAVCENYAVERAVAWAAYVTLNAARDTYTTARDAYNAAYSVYAAYATDRDAAYATAFATLYIEQEIKIMTQTLTLQTLIDKGACAEAQEKFAQIFSNGAPLTVEAFVNVAAKFDWSCAARLLLTPRNQVKFENTRAAARDTLNATTDAYNASCDARDDALLIYNVAYASCDVYNASCDVYNAACASCDVARDAYNAAYSAYAAYATDRDAAYATAFATLYIQQESPTL